MTRPLPSLSPTPTAKRTPSTAPSSPLVTSARPSLRRPMKWRPKPCSRRPASLGLSSSPSKKSKWPKSFPLSLSKKMSGLLETLQKCKLKISGLIEGLISWFHDICSSYICRCIMMQFLLLSSSFCVHKCC